MGLSHRLPSCPGSSSSSSSSMEREARLVRNIYFGRIGSEATERLLERFGHDGSFMLRDSQTVPGAYCLCVRHTPFVHTYRLTHSADGWSLQDPAVRRQSFGTVEALIEGYRTGLDPAVAPLREPLDRTQIQNTNQGQEFLYMEMCSSAVC